MTDLHVLQKLQRDHYYDRPDPAVTISVLPIAASSAPLRDQTARRPRHIP
jgi:hypothetical protein